MEILQSIVNTGNDFLWGKLLIILLLALGVYFTFRTNFVQFRLIGEMLRLMKDGVGTKHKAVSSFQAFCISTASRVGTGNMAGVALAISVGGPGAVFWMWLIALIGSASGFVESTLAQIYKIKDGHGYRGGPAYYMELALGQRWMGVLFAVLISITFGLIFNSVQSNTISMAFNGAYNVDQTYIGIVLAVLTGIVIFGGIKRIAIVAEVIVPIMAGIYILIALYVVVTNITALPGVIADIIASAFGLKEVVGGGIGAAVMQGVKRGLFSNEAGMGSVPNAAATAEVSHPVKQGLIQAMGVFVDTLLICSATAFIILLSSGGALEGSEGIQITQAALSFHIGAWASNFIALMVLMFAFSSIVGNYYYGETNIEFIKSRKIWLTAYRLAVVGMVFFGSIAELGFVWTLADLFMALMALINLVAIAILGKFAFAALKDYTRQKNAGKEPVFYASNIEGLKGVECWQGEKSV